MSVTVKRLDSSTKIGACCSSLDAAEIAVNSCVERRPRRIRFPSISARIETRRWTTCDQDEIGGLQPAGLLVDRLDSGADTDAEVAARVDLLGIAAQRDVQRN